MNVRIASVLVALLLPVTLFSQNNAGYDIGYHPSVEAGVVLNNVSAVASAMTSQGYCFGNGLYLGGVTGLVFGAVSPDGGRAQMIPVMAEVKYSFLDRKASPFVSLRTGAMFDLSSDGFAGGAGFVLRPTIGVDIRRFSVSVGVNLQSLSFGTTGVSGSGSTTSWAGKGMVFFPGFTSGTSGNSGIYAGLAYYF